MKTKLLFLPLLPMFCLTTFAQVASYNLSDYKLPDIKRQTLEASVDLSGNKRKTENNFSDTKYHEKNTLNSGNFLLHYTRYVNSRKNQNWIQSYVNVSDNYNYTDRNADTLKSTSNSFNTSFTSIIRNSWYFNKIFIETDLDLMYYFYHKKDESSRGLIYAISKGNTHDLAVNIPLKAGVGRIEQVQDARQAIYILDELSKQNRLSRPVTNEDIAEMAKFISQLKNRRFFDFRIQKIYEIEAIDSFMNKNTLVSKSDARYFTTLNDYWLYGDPQIRNSGTRFAMFVIPGINYDKSSSNNSLPYSLKHYIFSTGLELTYEKPINLYWQNTIELKGSFRRSIVKNNASDLANNYTNSKQNEIQFNLYHKLGYYPNTRTEANFSYGLSYLKLLNNYDNAYYPDLKNQSASLFSSLFVNYYISERLRLNFIANIQYAFNKGNRYAGYDFDLNRPFSDDYTDKNLAENFELKLAYSIF